jgi:hypothetical protein
MSNPDFIWFSDKKTQEEYFKEKGNCECDNLEEATELEVENPLWESWRILCYEIESRDHKSHYSLQFYVEEKYKGAWKDLGLSPLRSINELSGLEVCLDYITLKDGETEEDFFDDYSEDQLVWINSGDRENLSILASDIRDFLSNQQ